MAWTPIVGVSLQPDEFYAYVRGLAWKSWKPNLIVLHNTAAPSLAQRPNGFTPQGIKNLESYFRDQQGWPAGPHLFIDDRQIWVFTPLTSKGTHSPSYNGTAIGIEMLGDFAREEFTSGRGAKVRANTIEAIAALNVALGFRADKWIFHVQDPKTTHDCPGIKARRDRDNLVREINEKMVSRISVKDAMGTPQPWDRIG